MYYIYTTSNRVLIFEDALAFCITRHQEEYIQQVKKEEAKNFVTVELCCHDACCSYCFHSQCRRSKDVPKLGSGPWPVLTKTYRLKQASPYSSAELQEQNEVYVSCCNIIRSLCIELESLLNGTKKKGKNQKNLLREAERLRVKSWSNCCHRVCFLACGLVSMKNVGGFLNCWENINH